RVRVVVTALGGGYGGKIAAKQEPLAVLLARKARRPVKVALRPDEDCLGITKHASTVRLRSAVTRDGTLLAQEATCYFNAGAYCDSTPNLLTHAYSAAGPYFVPNVRVEAIGVYTNAVPAGAFQGYGISQVAWA